MAAPKRIISKEQIASFSEEELRQRVIIPLMIKMGYEDAYEWHGGPGELGKDVVGSRPGDFGELENVAVVAKRGRIVGRASSEVARQVRQAFNSTFRAQFGNDDRTPNKVWVVTNAGIPKTSRDQIITTVGLQQAPYIVFVDIERVWIDWCEHFPVSFYQTLDEIQSHIGNVDPALNVRAWVDKASKGIEVSVGQDELLTDEHIAFTGKATFPDTPEGRAKLQEFQAALDTGSPVDLPREYFDLQIPSALKRLAEQVFGIIPGDFDSTRISSVEDPRSFSVRIELVCDDGDSTVIEYVEWRVTQQGAKETTLSNDRQSIPLRVTLVLDIVNATGQMSFLLSGETAPVYWHLKWLEVRRCFAKAGTTTFTLVETGSQWARARREDQPDIAPTNESRFSQFWQTLLNVEQVIRQTIYFPVGDPEEEDKVSAIKLMSIYRDPNPTGTWQHVEIEVSKRSVIDDFISFLDNDVAPFRALHEEFLQIGGSLVSLGRVQLNFDSARLASTEDIRHQLEHAADEESPIVVRFVPGDNNLVILQYLDWSPIEQLDDTQSGQ